MSTTHSTSNRASSQNSGAYTVIGGDTLDRENKGRSGLSIVLLNSGARPFRNDLFDELCKIGATEVISIESAPCPQDVEALSRRHDRLRFMVFSGESNTGARIDEAFREALCDHVFVLTGEMHINASSISSRVFSRISEGNKLCRVPVFRDPDGEALPTAVGPLPDNTGTFNVQPIIPGRDETATLIPWSYSGVYRKDKHEAIGGFDPLIKESWWQLLEYGMRAWLWGEEISTHPALRVAYIEEPAPQESSLGPGYRRFFLKTLAVRRRGDLGRLPRSRWWSYLRNSGDHSRSAVEDWKDIRSWVHANRYRFVKDASGLIELWPWSER